MMTMRPPARLFSWPFLVDMRRASLATLSAHALLANADSSAVGVIGGGVAGITAARTLAAAGVPVTVHEQSTGLIGGRLGVTEVGGRLVGTGCSYIKAKHPDFVRELQLWVNRGQVSHWQHAKPHMSTKPGEWSPIADVEGERWYVGAPHMASPVQQLDEGTDVNIALMQGSSIVKAERVTADGDSMWELTTPASNHRYSQLVVATPVHAAGCFLDHALLDSALGEERRAADFVKERVSATVVFSRSLELPFNFGVLASKGSAVTVAICESSRWEAGAANNSRTRGTADEEVWVLQSDTGWARRAIEEQRDDARMACELLESFAAALGMPSSSLPTVVAASAVVWPYGDADYMLDGGCAWLDEMQLALAGDYTFNGRVEGAWLSGRAAARNILKARGLGESLSE